MRQEFRYEVVVVPEAIDANGHVNNVEFVRWMQEAAVAHSDSVGCTAATRENGAMWVARSHHIRYLRPAFLKDHITVRTWVGSPRRSFSLRSYEMVRSGDGIVLANGETEWVYIDVTSGRPRSIPPDIADRFQSPATR